MKKYTLVLFILVFGLFAFNINSTSATGPYNMPGYNPTGVLCPNGNTLYSNCTEAPDESTEDEILCPNGKTLASNCTSAPTREGSDDDDPILVPTFSFTKNLSLGSKGNEVLELQKILKNESYYL